MKYEKFRATYELDLRAYVWVTIDQTTWPPPKLTLKGGSESDKQFKY